MSGPKTEFNNQWGRTAEDGGDAIPASQTPAPADNQGKARLTDRFGRVWVVLANPDNGPPITVGNVVPVPGAIAENKDSLQGFSFIGPGVPTDFVDTGPLKFYYASAYNPTNQDCFLMIFNQAGNSAPVNGAIPATMVKMFDGNDNEPTIIDFLNLGILFPDNLKVAISTTPLFLTLPASDDFFITVLYYNQ